jgi:hypothetical protein
MGLKRKFKCGNRTNVVFGDEMKLKNICTRRFKVGKGEDEK